MNNNEQMNNNQQMNINQQQMQTNTVNNNVAGNTVLNNTGANLSNIPEEYKPISMWGYFGYEILFSIPCVGFILLLVYAFGGTKNVNLKNFARSYFCFLIIVVVITFILVSVAGFSGISSAISNSCWYSFS